MTEAGRYRRAAVAFGLMAITAAAPVYAYIDPGSGLLYVQILLSAIAGAVAFIKHPIESMKALLRRIRRTKE